MKIITIGGLPAAGKTYTSKLIAQQKNYLALEIEKLRWSFFESNYDENLYKYTQDIKMLENENMREYYLRCTLYERKMPLELMVEWHKNTMKFIEIKFKKIIEENELIKKEEDYINFCNKYKELINYMPKYEFLNKEVIICSHAFINTITLSERERVQIDFKSNMNVLIDRFKQRENIIDSRFDKNIEIYYKSYEEVLKNSEANVLDTCDVKIIEKINDLI